MRTGSAASVVKRKGGKPGNYHPRIIFELRSRGTCNVTERRP